MNQYNVLTYVYNKISSNYIDLHIIDNDFGTNYDVFL